MGKKKKQSEEDRAARAAAVERNKQFRALLEKAQAEIDAKKAAQQPNA